MDVGGPHRWKLSLVALLVGLLFVVLPSCAEAAQLINAEDSTLAWSFSSSPNAVDGTPARYNGCALHEPNSNFFDCKTEFFYQRPDGTDGSRWFFTSGYVQWTGVHVNPYGPGEVGTPHSYSS